MKLFYDLIHPTEDTTVLDVGAEINPNGDRGLQLIDSYQWKSRLSAINLSSQHTDEIKRYYPEIDARVGDACNLPWPDKSFDVVYSNAVIEHVGNLDQQHKMAAEIMRVGKSWFVTTPNRWYPYEFHMRLPFVTWLPGHGYLWAGRIMSYNHVKKKYVYGIKQEFLRLLTADELRRCFPNSRIIKPKVTFMAETVIAVGGDILR